MTYIIGFLLVCLIVVGIAFWVELMLQKAEDDIFMTDPKGLRRYE